MNLEGTLKRWTPVACVVMAVGCSESGTDVGATTLLSVLPVPGSTSVEVNSAIAVHFTQAVTSQATSLVALHAGACPGPIVAGTWSRSDDGSTLSFIPAAALDPGTRYTVHLAGGVTDMHGHVVDLERSGLALGGAWVTESQVMDMPAMGMGMMMTPPHAGADWLHPNGYYGLGFDFTTGGS